MYIFISHSSKNSVIAEEICDMLINNGHSCFFASRDIRSGHEYAEEIVNGIDRSDAMLLLLSEDANSSPHVLREVERAVSKSIPIIVYKLEEVVLSKSMEYFLMTHQWVVAKPKIDHSEILDCINELEGASAPAAQEAAPEAEVSAASSRKRSIVTAAVCAAVLVAIGVIAAVCLSGGGEDASEASAPLQVELGERLVFGSYNEQPIEWRVIELGDGTATLISDRILTMKCFDAAEGGSYNFSGGKNYWNTSSKELDAELDVSIRGNSSWEASNIRTWLNSDSENITYTGQAPSVDAMSENANGYNTEAGFLNDFTAEEKAAIITTDVTTNGTVTEDMVWLLSSEELALLETADVSRYSVPTEQAVALDTCKWYELNRNDYGVNDHYWWLRDADGETASGVNVVCFSYASGAVVSLPAGLEGYGIRPVVTVDLTSSSVKIKE